MEFSKLSYNDLRRQYYYCDWNNYGMTTVIKSFLCDELMNKIMNVISDFGLILTAADKYYMHTTLVAVNLLYDCIVDMALNFTDEIICIFSVYFSLILRSTI